ncbi:MAG TPA: tRNA (adenosine(37)-N6)-threonylcarbamoyltransferase complex ATPase subunit type 1 TsaE [Pirellulales bacterium]|nr:tRNA (adenosine(37)-N6)-threonylcarbamoyltransferase complex ATPase subunit type 1 TsaE [Pirellulales bacterium]
MPSTEPLVFDAVDEAATAALGRALAECLPPRAVVALIGNLGAGKTRLVQAVAESAGVDPRDVISPTFVLIHEYEGRVPIYHFDAYRLRDEQEFLRLGPEEYFDRPGWSFIEWADRVERCLPTERIEIRIEQTGPSSRRFIVSAIGDDYSDALTQLRERPK